MGITHWKKQTCWGEEAGYQTLFHEATETHSVTLPPKTLMIALPAYALVPCRLHPRKLELFPIRSFQNSSFQSIIFCWPPYTVDNPIGAQRGERQIRSGCFKSRRGVGLWVFVNRYGYSIAKRGYVYPACKFLAELGYSRPENMFQPEKIRDPPTLQPPPIIPKKSRQHQ